ncbi:hypothetical protein PCL_09432 [Purpureocillium lilacinum]|uniref:Uncharacterized protein n=1 Tax=Purpureocillium lilacinum TaxID=33203 RepID=A0A2U3EI26_PURLI|nr:hypothetical protein PCL_09432 [Purpureocillium lilacinum]
MWGRRKKRMRGDGVGGGGGGGGVDSWKMNLMDGMESTGTEGASTPPIYRLSSVRHALDKACLGSTVLYMALQLLSGHSGLRHLGHLPLKKSNLPQPHFNARLTQQHAPYDHTYIRFQWYNSFVLMHGTVPDVAPCGSNGNNGSDGYKAGGRAAAAGGTLLGAPSVRFPKRQLLASDHCSWKPRSPLHTSWWSASWRFPGAAAAASAARHFQQGGVPPLQAGKQPKMHGVGFTCAITVRMATMCMQSRSS